MVPRWALEEQGLTLARTPTIMGGMRRETVEQILADRQIELEDGAYAIPEDERVTLLVGHDQVTAIGGIVKLTLASGYLLAESRKGTKTYTEYETIRALSFELKEVADRQAGFV
jgi:hypothetical protein